EGGGPGGVGREGVPRADVDGVRYGVDDKGARHGAVFQVLQARRPAAAGPAGRAAALGGTDARRQGTEEGVEGWIQHAADLVWDADSGVQAGVCAGRRTRPSQTDRGKVLGTPRSCCEFCDAGGPARSGNRRRPPGGVRSSPTDPTAWPGRWLSRQRGGERREPTALQGHPGGVFLQTYSGRGDGTGRQTGRPGPRYPPTP